MRYLALGDSYTIGEGVPAEQQWPRHLLRLLEQNGIAAIELVMIARTAWTTDELLDAIDAAPPRGRFGLVSLMIGVNDQYRNRSLTEFDRDFGAVFDRASAFAPTADRLIVLSIPDWGASPYASGQDGDRIAREIDAFNERERLRVSRAGARWVDVTVASKEMRRDRSLAIDDGLHPSGVMYFRWAELVLPVVLEALRRR